MSAEKNFVLFGAGQIGKRALSYFGREKVRCFADNSAEIAGTWIDGVPVITFEQLKKIYRDVQIVISMDVAKSVVVATQLEEAGILDYKIYLKILESDQAAPVPTSIPRFHKGERIGKNDGKNVLMITYSFPPLSGSGVFRSLKFAKYLPLYGWTPIVFAADRPRLDWNYVDQSLMDDIPEDMEVIRLTDTVGTLQELSLLKKQNHLLPFLYEVLRKDPDAEEIFNNFLKTKIGSAEMLTFPCAALLWSYNVVRYIEENLDIGQIDVVYTSSDPYSAHLVGFYFKEKYDIPWVADYRDPWSKSTVPGSIPKLDEPRGKLFCILESILFKAADCSIEVEEELAQDYAEEFFCLDSKKIVCITNGYDELDFASMKPALVHTDYFTINFSGTLHVDQSIDAILEAVRQLAEENKIDLAHVKIRFVGAVRQQSLRAVAKKFGLEDIVVETGYVSHRQALQYNLDSNLLLLFAGGEEEKYKFMYTSKIFEYLRSGRPILAIGPKDGSIDRTLQSTGHGKLFLSAQIPEIKTMIFQEYQKWQTGMPIPLLHSPKIDLFERKVLSKKLAHIFESVKK